MDVPYPTPSVPAPPDLTKPSARFQRQAVGAALGLVVFLGLYFFLTAWFGWLVLRSLQAMVLAGPSLLRISTFLASSFFVGFLIKGLFFIRRDGGRDLLQITETEQPRLFAFVRKIAADAGAPAPHRVFLSPRVNAAVFYDLGFWNLVFPTKKNLEIGIGLVNALSIDEFKAVIAHEFGHFAQKSMRVGTWVYLSQQFVGSLVVRRDIFDSLLSWLSRIDLRVAWIGWAMRLVVWSLRAILDTAFRGVVLLQRALSRQMEFQADLVSVSLTGSESLIHALHRLGAADDAWERAAHIAFGKLATKQKVTDVFALQSRILERLRAIHGKDDYGSTPTPKSGTERATQRVFKSGIAEAPRMWETHPPNHEREENAKRVFLPSTLDDRPAWALFADEEAVRAKVTDLLLSSGVAHAELGEGAPQHAVLPLEGALSSIDEIFGRSRFQDRYRGAYLREDLTRHAHDPEELFGLSAASSREEVLAALDGLYPVSLRADLEKRDELAHEKIVLEGLKEGFLEAPGGVIRFRGREIRRRELPRVIAEVAQELTKANRTLEEHDGLVHGTYRAAAELLGRGWEPHLVGLVHLVHYAEHSLADVEDSVGYVNHVFRIITADQKVTAAELERLRKSASDVYVTLWKVFEDRHRVALPSTLRDRLDGKEWSSLLPEHFSLNDPTADDLATDWLSLMDIYAGRFANAFLALRAHALDVLLEVESHLDQTLRASSDPGDAPPPATVPSSFTRCRRGEERPRQKRLDLWDRFQVADGPVAGAARLAVAAAVVAPVLVFASTADTSTVLVHNGFGSPVHVTVGARSVDVGPFSSERVTADTETLQILAKTQDGREIERFEAEAPSVGTTSVYNVAQASVLVAWTAIYGPIPEQPPNRLGAPRWVEDVSFDYFFTEPPDQISTQGNSATRSVLSALDELAPNEIASALDSPEDVATVGRAHCLWEPATHPMLADWCALVARDPEVRRDIARRLEEQPRNVALARVAMDDGTPEERRAICERYAGLSEAHPEEGDFAYLAMRCLEDPRAQGEAFLAARDRFPGHPWVLWGVANELASRGVWSDARSIMEDLLSHDGGHLGEVGLPQALLRLRRIEASQPLHADSGDLTSAWPAVGLVLKIERGALDADSPPWAAVFAELEAGHLSVEPGPDARDAPILADFAVLVGASDGATDVQKQAALDVPASVLSWRTLWLAMALAVRAGRDVAAFEARSEELFGSHGASVAPIFAPGALDADPSLLDRIVETVPFQTRGAARVAGLVLLGDRAPASWRREARALLLATERPYLRAAPPTPAL